jgi:DNA-binding Lrp family transcriptional regulator
VQIRLQPHTKETAQVFEARIGRVNEVLDCHLMTGDTDYLLRVVVESLEAYEVFIREKIHTIPAIASINTSFAYGVVKQSRCLP